LAAQFHLDPDRYLARTQARMPRYSELQERSIEAIPFVPERVLELGIGTGETTRYLLARYPGARVTALDSSPEMVFCARELGIEDVRLARMQDPLPDGPWDLVISVLSVHHLGDDGKRDLFRRVREHSRALVIGDVVQVPPQRRVTPLGEGADMASPAAGLAAWGAGEVTWEADDLAVVRAIY
jgi:tRNA (cmo5U34)-methyltransferase